MCISSGAASGTVHRPSLLLARPHRSEEHTSELQSHSDLVCRLLLEKKKNKTEHALDIYVISSCGISQLKRIALTKKVDETSHVISYSSVSEVDCYRLFGPHDQTSTH